MPSAFPQVFDNSQPFVFDRDSFTRVDGDAGCRFQYPLPRSGQLEVFGTPQKRTRPISSNPVRSSSNTRTSTLHVQTFAIGAYDLTNTGLAPLPATVSGAKKLEEAFRHLNGKSYQSVRVWDGVYDADATLQNIRERFSELASESGPEDVVFLYFAGHGMVPAGQELFYFAPADFRGPNPESERETGLSTAMLAQAVRDIPARRIVLVIDACQSGGVLDSLAKIAEIKAKENSAASKPDAGIYIISGATPLQTASQPLDQDVDILTATIVDALKGPSAERGISVSQVVRAVSAKLPVTGKQSSMVIQVGSDFPLR